MLLPAKSKFSAAQNFPSINIAELVKGNTVIGAAYDVSHSGVVSGVV